MKKAGVLAGLFLAGCATVEPGAVGRVDLFNGKDLAGWTAVVDHDATGGYAAPEPTWAVVDGAIRTTGTPFGYLRTKRTDFADGKLHVEYRWWRKTEKPNSGVFVRIGAEHGTFLPTCHENQLCLGSAGDVLGLAGAPIAGCAAGGAFTPEKPLSGISRAAKKAESSEKPFGEWNVLEVELDGDVLVNRVNGVEQNRVKGVANRRGAIALQSEGGAVEFRNAWFEEMKK
ncbi:MAG: DUF1080 domain-containing protein [Kiritimatiellae bacterium]|nr:DUF1080 domain-containing protein [Kiritimatiellia bacterium]